MANTDTAVHLQGDVLERIKLNRSHSGDYLLFQRSNAGLTRLQRTCQRLDTQRRPGLTTPLTTVPACSLGVPNGHYSGWYPGWTP